MRFAVSQTKSRKRRRPQWWSPISSVRDPRVIDGPFASMNGKVEEVNATRAKLRVMVSIFGRPTSVELDFTQVERLG